MENHEPGKDYHIPYFVVRTSFEEVEPSLKKCDNMFITPQEIRIHALENKETFKMPFIYISLIGEEKNF